MTDKKKRKNEYQDPFEAYHIQREANRQRMIKEKRLNVIRGASAVNSGTTPATLVGVDKLRFKKSRNVNSGNNSAKVSLSGLRGELMELHNKPIQPQTINSSTKTRHSPDNKSGRDISKKRHNKPISILQLNSIINNATFTSGTVRNGFQNRYLKISKEILNPVLRQLNRNSNISLNTFFKNITYILKWLKFNRFDYVIADRNINQYKVQIISNMYTPQNRPKILNVNELLNRFIENNLKKKEGDKKRNMVEKFVQQKYFPPIQLKKNHYIPTHMVESFKKIGSFMISVKVKNLDSKLSNIILLMRADIRFKIEREDFLLLKDSYMHYQEINGCKFPTYLTFQIFKKDAMDFNFFK